MLQKDETTMRRAHTTRRIATSAVAWMIAGCNGGAAIVGQDGGARTQDGGVVVEDPRWGKETAQGPRVQGTSMGMVTVNGHRGAAFDSNGDGQADEIDIDGDGVSDGEDIDGDGVITVWSDLEDDDDDLEEESAAASTVVTVTPAAVSNQFAVVEPLPGESPSGPMVGPVGGVDTNGGMVATSSATAGVLRARNQGGLGSCSTFAVSAAIAMTRYRREVATNPTLDINTLWPSPLYLYQYNSRWIPGRSLADGGMTSGTCDGTNSKQNMSRFVTHGAPAESDLPYPTDTTPMASYCSMPASDRATTSASREAFRITGIASIDPRNFREEARRVLSMRRPIVFGVSLPEGFHEWRRTSAFNANMPTGTDTTQVYRGRGQCTGEHCSGHAMVITDYDDTRGAYRVLNSWGTDWGDQGYIWWAYESLEALRPYGLVPIPLPATAPPALTTPNPMGFTVTQVPGTSAYLAPVKQGDDTWWAIWLRVRLSEPATYDGSNSRFPPTLRFGGGTFDTTMIEGDLPLVIPGTSASSCFDVQRAVGGTLEANNVWFTLRDGTQIQRPLPDIVVPAPAAPPPPLPGTCRRPDAGA